MTEIIGPDGLEADAVVPQCLDNQYVSDDIFSDMIRRGVDYEDERVSQARERNFRTEFNRSLTYSSQVVIQRAFLKNSDFLYKNYQPQNKHNLQAFASLMRQHAIVPFLMYESSPTDNLEMDIRREGDAATSALLDAVGNDVRCVRLAVGDAENARATDAMTSAFGAGISWLEDLQDSQRNAMASELFKDPTVLQEDGAWDKFNTALDDLAHYAYTSKRRLRQEGKKIFRSHVYQDCFIAGDSPTERQRNVALGRFKAPSTEEPFLLELKKYVDLVYNTNLPDRLKRYTFTPTSMPSRMALQDFPGIAYGNDQILSSISDPESMMWIARSFMSRTQAAMSLPLLSDLTVSDILEIRSLPEWQPFKEAQTAILTDPLHILDRLELFDASFNEFQKAISDWYNRTYKRDQTIQRYTNFISLALSIGGQLIIAGSHLDRIHEEIAGKVTSALISRIPQRVKGYTAKLLVGVYDIEQRRLDKDRAYTIELMQTSEELARDDVIDLLNSVTLRSRESAIPNISAMIADQGIH